MFKIFNFPLGNITYLTEEGKEEIRSGITPLIINIPEESRNIQPGLLTQEDGKDKENVDLESKVNLNKDLDYECNTEKQVIVEKLK